MFFIIGANLNIIERDLVVFVLFRKFAGIISIGSKKYNLFCAMDIFVFSGVFS